MRLFLLFLSICSFSFGAPPWTYRVDTASANMVATFPNVPQVSGPANAISSFDVSNASGSEIEVNCSSATKPTALSTASVFVPPNTSYSSPVNTILPTPLLKVCWIRSVAGTISSGVIEVVAWGY